jgi:HD-GYP domain-containing protein (c-di-GMP phosphodiesterase class II)
LEAGVSDGALWPTSAALVQISKSRKSWVVALHFDRHRQLQPADLKLMVLARRLLLNHSRQLQAAERLKETLFGLIHCLTAAIDAKDPYTCGHSERVARIASRLGQEMNLPEGVLSDLYLAGLLHDVGKIGIEDRILRKPGALTEDEMRIIQEHPVIGDRIIASVRPLAHLRPGVRNHHERYDGRGYPDGLAGLDIPLMARILAVADSCDAMIAARPYRPSMPTPKIEAVFAGGAGSQWDPQVVEAFTKCRQELYTICQRGIGDSLMLAVGHAVEGSPGRDRSIMGHIFPRDARARQVQ